MVKDGDNYVNETEGITPASSTNATIESVYSVSGVRQQQMGHGVNIVRMSDGTVRKIFVK